MDSFQEINKEDGEKGDALTLESLKIGQHVEFDPKIGDYFIEKLPELEILCSYLDSSLVPLTLPEE